MDPLPGTAAFIEFGRFTLLPYRRELLADGQPIELGGRAFEVLLALIDAPGAVLTKDELMGRVWPGRVVEENSLQAQVSALRKALGADRDLIRTVAGRGYQFTGETPMRGVTASPRRASNLPEPISELIGRETAMAEVSDLMTAHRLVTLAGIGGIGKTRLGLEVARQLLPRFSDGVWIAELGPLSDPELVPVTVATALGLSLAAGSISPPSIAAALARSAFCWYWTTASMSSRRRHAWPRHCCAPARPRACSPPAASRCEQKGSTFIKYRRSMCPRRTTSI